MTAINNKLLPLSRDECLHTLQLIHDLFYNNVTDSVYARSGINDKLESALPDAETALGKVYQTINEENEGIVND